MAGLNLVIGFLLGNLIGYGIAEGAPTVTILAVIVLVVYIVEEVLNHFYARRD